MKSFEDQVVVVSGGTRGIGRGIVEAFLKGKARVVATYGHNDEAAKSFKSSLGPWGEKLELRKFDISSAPQVKTFYGWLRENYQTLDILVNNAGIRRDQILASLEERDWDRVLEVNLKGTYLMSQEAVLLMLSKRYGRIVNISSLSGVLGLAGQGHYAASKAGQVALSKSLSKEVAKKGITINNVLPGFIETEMIADLSPEQLKEYKRQVPMRRFGRVEEVAATVLFLASPEASYITGASLEVGGGL